MKSTALPDLAGVRVLLVEDESDTRDIIQRMLEVMLADYQKSWGSVYSLQFEFVRAEMQTQFVNIASPTEVVVVSTFNLEVGSGGGPFHICLPYSMLEPIRDLIYSPMPGDQSEPDRRWVRSLAQQVQSAEVDLVARLGTARLRLKDLIDLKPGDVLPVDIPDTILGEIDSVPVMECKYGILNGRYALRIERMLRPDQDANVGGSHA